MEPSVCLAKCKLNDEFQVTSFLLQKSCHNRSAGIESTLTGMYVE